MTDNIITLWHPYTGKEATGYRGFGGETLCSFGFVWLGRGNTRQFLTALTPLIDFVLLPSVLLLLPDVREILLAPFPGTDIPLLVFFLLILGLPCLCGARLIAAHANRLHTAERFGQGYALPAAAANLDEARAALKLPPSRTNT